MVPIEVIRVPEAELASYAASWFEARLAAVVAVRGTCHLAVSGGRSPWAAFDLLADASLPWADVHVWQVDERIAPDGDPARNAVGLTRTLGRTAATIHLMDVTHSRGGPVAGPAGAGTAAERYGTELATTCGGVLDLVHLGLGDDGHTASWPPGDPVIDVADRDVAVSAPYQGHRRITLTVPCVNRARTRVFLVGADKAEPLERLLAGDGSIPASRVRRIHTIVLGTS